MGKQLKSLTREQRRQVRLQRLNEDTRLHKVRLGFINKARNFFKRIGLPTVEVPSYIPDPEGCFFKGVWIAEGKLHYCPARVDVGELLHEAGHMALQPKEQWPTLPHTRWEDIYPPLGAWSVLGDAAVEAWDYAAALAADIPELAVFMNGFGGNGCHVWEAFAEKRHPGFLLLRFLGMSKEYGKVTRWFVGDAKLDGLGKDAIALIETCTKEEVQALEAALKAYINDCNS